MPNLSTKMEPDVSPPSLPVLIERGDFSAVASHCEELKLQAAMNGAIHPLFTPHLFSLLLLERFPAARLLILQRKAREPPPSSTEAAAIRVGEALWKRKTAEFFQQIRSFAWDAGMQPLALELERVTRERVYTLLATGYSCVPVSVIAGKIGWKPDETRCESISRGWTPLGPGEDANFLCPPAAQPRQTRPYGDATRKITLLAEQLVRMQTSS